MNFIVERGEPFLYPGSDIGCLLVHGLTGAPEEMRWMGKYLADQGFTVLGVRLFAHATNVADMDRARWRDWVAGVEDGYHMLRGLASKVVLMGVSMGGALSLLLARDHPVAGVLVMATPSRLPYRPAERARALLPVISKFVPTLKLPGESDWVDKEAEALQLYYRKFPVRAAVELHELLAQMRGALREITAPTLLLYARGDLETSSEDAQFIHDGLGASDKQILWIENSGHNIPRDAARMEAFEAAAAFVHHVAG